MDDFKKYENESYKRVKVQYGIKDHLSYLINLLKFGVSIFVIAIREIFENIFFPMPKKNLAGQLALITG